MKKIALASAAMGGVALFAFGASGTFASFTDTEAVTATAAAGTMDLQVGKAVTTSGAALALNPGDSTTMSYWMNNVGTVPGTLSAKLSVTDAENGCTDPEKKVGTDNCSDWATGGEFSQYAQVQFLDSDAVDAETCKAATQGTPVNEMAAVVLKDAVRADQIAVGNLANGAGNCVVLKVTLPEGAGNVVQGDTAQIKMDVTLAQPSRV